MGSGFRYVSHLTCNGLFLTLPFIRMMKFVDNFLCIAADRQTASK